MTARKVTERERAVAMTKTERAIIAAAYAWWADWHAVLWKDCRCVKCMLVRAIEADRKAKKRGKR